jgi:MraZ protein
MGQFEHALDDKGRVIVPSKLRDEVRPSEDGEGFVATVAPEGCLYLYTPREWERIAAAMERLPRGAAQFRRFQRRWYSAAERIAIDNQGRIVIPERLRSKAGISRELVLAGCYDRIEVWARDAWDAQSEGDDDYEGQIEQFLGGSQGEPAPAPEP